MKKLLILLCLTLGFSQSKMETRVFELTNYSLQEDNCEGNTSIFALLEEQGVYLEAAFINIIDANFESPWNNYGAASIYMKVMYNSDYLYSGNGFTLDFVREIAIPMQEFSGAFHNTSEHKVCYYHGGGSNSIQSADLFISVTAEFPDMDTGYIEEGFEFCLEEGANLTSFPCENDVALTTTLPQAALNNISSIVGQGEAALNNNGQFYGSLQNLKASKGYWIISNSAFCYNYTCAEN